MSSIRTLALATVAILGLFTASSAHAQNYYGGRIKNDSGMTIPYEIRLNQGAWVKQSIAPGETKHFWVTRAWFQRYKTSRYELEVRYDSLVGPGVHPHRKTLAMHWCYAPAAVRLNTFVRYNPYGQYTIVYLK